MSSRFGIGGAAFRTGGTGLVDTVAFGAYRRDVFDRIGGFAEDIDKGEDDEFNYRLLDQGGRGFGVRARLLGQHLKSKIILRSRHRLLHLADKGRDALASFE